MRLPGEVDAGGRTVVEQVLAVVDDSQQAWVSQATGGCIAGEGDIVEPQQVVTAVDCHVARELVGGGEVEFADKGAVGVHAGEATDEVTVRALEFIDAAAGFVSIEAGFADRVDLQRIATIGELPIEAHLWP